MNTHLSHEQLKKYIEGMADEKLSTAISHLKDTNIFYEVIFTHIEKIDRKNIALNKITVKQGESDFKNIERYLEELVSGHMNDERKIRFAQLIYQSPNFYSRLLTKIDQLTPLMDRDEIKELGDIHIKSNDDLIQDLNEEAEQTQSGGHLTLNSGDAPGQASTRHKSSMMRKFLYAAAAVLLITPSIYFLNNQFQTAYKNQIVQNILQENYRIYMSEQPRLSGEYQSTGISQLMSGEDDTLDYLVQADLLIDEVLDYDPDDTKALHLQAQIMILKENYQQADSVLNQALSNEFRSPQMLNDLGVLYFEKKEWKKAKTFFKLSIKQDSSYPEAYYNLALSEIKLGNKQDALKAIDKFLNHETDHGWRNAGLHLKQTMEGE